MSSLEHKSQVEAQPKTDGEGVIKAPASYTQSPLLSLLARHMLEDSAKKKELQDRKLRAE